MNKAVDTLFNLCHLEELARRDTWLNRLHPLSKLVVTFIYIIAVATAGNYALETVILYGIYPVVILTCFDLPLRPLAGKMIIPVLMATGIGMLNPFFDSNHIVIAGGYSISAGWISLLVLFLKSVMTIFAAIALVATTKIEEIAYALTCIKVPRVMTVQFLLMYRYITVLINEVDRVITAYSMRSGGKRSIDYRAWGSLIGQLFIRTSNRAVEIHEAMRLRGFDGHFHHGKDVGITSRDIAYVSVCCALILGILFFL